jgi:hypothetical protein
MTISTGVDGVSGVSVGTGVSSPGVAPPPGVDVAGASRIVGVAIGVDVSGMFGVMT